MTNFKSADGDGAELQEGEVVAMETSGLRVVMETGVSKVCVRIAANGSRTRKPGFADTRSAFLLGTSTDLTSFDCALNKTGVMLEAPPRVRQSAPLVMQLDAPSK